MEIPLGDLSKMVGDFLGIGTVAGGLLLSGLFTFGILMALAVLNVNLIGEAVAGNSFLGLFTALGWFPIWLMLLVAFITAVLTSGKISQMAKGGAD